MSLLWLTDIHLEFLSPVELKRFLVRLAQARGDALLITGDISQAPTLEAHLRILERLLERPIYFVLGNHDFYSGSIAGVRTLATRLTRESPHTRWLPAVGVVPLSFDTALVGHDGWADARLGDPVNSRAVLNDFKLIEDFVGLELADRTALQHRLGDEAAAYLRSVLPAALRDYRRVIVATHVPPFAEASWHMGRMSDEDWLPHFACKATGDVLRQMMEDYPDREMLVLCGHTHSPHEVRIRPNLVVRSGGAKYGEPGVQGTVNGEQ
ncbi:MAG: metallophosphoesterase [Gemmatimonadales bacterium]